jgi:N-acetyl-anhydromuramyl-L-alanine amidase AmpD
LLPIKQMIIPVNEFSRPGIKLQAVKGIVLHYTACNGAPAVNIANYFGNLRLQNPNDSQPDTYASAHFAVDENTIVQVLPEDEMAYEVGANWYTPEALSRLSSYPNNCTIGIEMCIDENGNILEGTFQNAADLTAYLCQKYGLGINNLWRHYDITHKNCPAPWVANPSEWERFKQAVAARIGKVSAQPVSGTPMDKLGVVTGTDADGLHVRAYPSSSSEARYTLHNGDVIHLVEHLQSEGHGWYKTTYGPLGGYVWDQYVQIKQTPQPASQAPQDAPCNVAVNGQMLAIKGFIRDNKSYVPVRAIADAVKATVGWDSACGQVILNSVQLKTTVVKDDHGYAWSREVAEVLKLQLSWDEGTKTVRFSR